LVEGFLKKLASVVCFMDPVEDLRPLMVLLRSLRRRAADLVLHRAWRRLLKLRRRGASGRGGWLQRSADWLVSSEQRAAIDIAGCGD